MLGGVLIYTMLFCLGLRILLHAVQGCIGNHAGNRHGMPHMRRKFDTVALDLPCAAVLCGQVVLLGILCFLKAAGEGSRFLVGCFCCVLRSSQSCSACEH